MDVEKDLHKDMLLGKAAKQAAKDAVNAVIGHVIAEEMGPRRTFAIMLFVINDLVMTSAKLFQADHPDKSMDDCIAETLGCSMFCLGFDQLTAALRENETLQ